MSGEYSREWSVLAVVGSTPWSAHRSSTSPGRSAACHSGRAASTAARPAAKPAHVVAVAPDLVEVDEVGEQQAVLHLAQVAACRPRCRRCCRWCGRRRRRRAARRSRRSCPRRPRARRAAAAGRGRLGRAAPARSRGAAACARSGPCSPSKGRAMTRPTACGPCRMARAASHHRRARPPAPRARGRRSGTPSRPTCRRWAGRCARARRPAPR